MSRRLTYWFNRRFYLTGWLLSACKDIVLVHSPPLEGWQA